MTTAHAGKGERLDINELYKQLYQAGEWDMFERITYVYFGKQCYFLDMGNNGIAYSKNSGKRMKREEAIQEFFDIIGSGRRRE